MVFCLISTMPVLPTGRSGMVESLTWLDWDPFKTRGVEWSGRDGTEKSLDWTGPDWTGLDELKESESASSIERGTEGRRVERNKVSAKTTVSL